MLRMNKLGTGIITMLLLTHSVFAQDADEMFSLIRKINVDHLGTVGQIDGCEFSKDNYFIIASDNHATAKIYVRETGEFVNQVRHIQMNNTKFEKAGKMNAVGYSFDRKYFYTGINDEGLKVWDAEKYTLVHHFAAGKSVDCADFSPDNKWLATAADNEVWIYSLPSFKKVHSYTHDLGEVNNLDFSSDGRYLVSCAGHGKKGDIRLVNVSDWSLAHRGKIGGSAKRICFSPDAKLYAVGSRGQLCRIVDTETGATVKDLVHGGNVLSLPGDDPDENAAIEALKWSADGHYLFTGSVIDGIMRVWRRDDWSMIGYVQAQAINRQVEYIDVSSDNEVIVGGDEGVLYHYKFTPPKLLKPIEQGADGIVCLEAENYDTSLPQGGHSWTLVSESGAAGGKCLQALPNDGVVKDKNFAKYDPLKDAPKLDYRINFTRAGKYHVWIRGKGNESDNAVHVGIDGKKVGSSDKIEFPASPSDYVWSKATKDGTDARLSISSVGAHTVNVWMSEDGTKLDRILLTLDGGYDPSSVNGGEGPKGSSR